LGGDARRSLELLYLIAVTEFRRSYLGTALGYVWSVAKPLLTFGVLLLVFTQAFRLGDTIPNYPVLLLFNIVLFTFFQEATGQAVVSIVNQEGVVRKTQFPRLVIPLAVVLTALFNLAVNLIVVVGFLIAFGITPRWTWLLFPLVLLSLFVLTTATAVLLSALYPRFRDTAVIWTVFATALFYGTPVLYAINVVSPKLQHLLLLNPLTWILEFGRKWIIDADAPSPWSLSTSAVEIVVPIVIYVGTCVLAVWFFEREAPRIAEEL
jgi:ABC-2 type transport system permease protein